MPPDCKDFSLKGAATMSTSLARPPRVRGAERKASAFTGAFIRKAKREIEALKPGQTWSLGRPMTVEEFNLLTPDETHAELWEGEVYMPAPATIHEIVCAFLFKLLGTYVD